MIEADGLTKRYGAKVAVQDLSFTVRPGRVTGFLGPNGAGKSTTMRMMLGLDQPTSGTVRIDGKRYAELKQPLRAVGALLDARWVHPNRSARTHLRWLAKSNRLSPARADEVLGMVGLDEVGHRNAGGFSLGMSQRLGLAAALLGDPGVLLFDEPVNGLDPEGIHWIRRFMQGLAAEGRTVLVSSHLLSEMSLTAEELVVIGRGQLIAQCSTREFVDSAGDGAVLVRSPQIAQLREALTAVGIGVRDSEPGSLLAEQTTTERIGELAAQRGIVLHELTAQRGSLEDAFMQMTNQAVEYQTGLGSEAPAAAGVAR
ncbi:ATP-binding cassette domain-containing protein [Saccharopolyspora sp. HNM0983]|uniref:ATP-binding cassette domain-containing protein n=1 Tax=Saccharopolyspora montiporae TaxID=2781240 RepID=A0A929G1H2_9PSEU|nr:ATP-binding cassette domain-containing protein [Saccharopolyspora sp. HNM0983]MBE9374678.1 ATP-binding cassette domain-containing protein [Saccharopolyspora sp. HNM0983]